LTTTGRRDCSATAYARTGDLEKAAIYFAPSAQFSTTPETLYNYANYLKLAGKKEEAREWAQKLVAKKRDAAQVHAKSGASMVPQGEGAAERVSGLTPTSKLQKVFGALRSSRALTICRRPGRGRRGQISRASGVSTTTRPLTPIAATYLPGLQREIAFGVERVAGGRQRYFQRSVWRAVREPRPRSRYRSSPFPRE